MSGWIEACKAQIQAIADGLLPKIQDKCKDIDVRVRWGVVAYRDVGDAQQLQELPFTEDSKELVAMVKKLQVQGGGDEPEDMMAALSAAAQLQWQAKARFLVLIADSPAHGSVMQQLRKQHVDLLVMPVKAHKLDKTAAAMRKHYDCPAEDRKLSCEPLFDSSKQPAHAFHFVFCLDSSGSMSGRPWQELLTAYQQLLTRRTSDQCAGDYMSVVTFDSLPRVASQLQQLTSAPQSFSYSGGGTCFTPALQRCDSLLAATPAGLTPILVFMSDGDDGGGSPVSVMQQLHATYSSRNLQVHTIAFG
uniref:VWFA domain-containing protein n=1 Tax=Tetradesmus obliquus TaxID=3088 RepID=A0A383V437_TETOB|eukprot:jgi/Sobl393_1/7711/SZX59479.1